MLILNKGNVPAFDHRLLDGESAMIEVNGYWKDGVWVIEPELSDDQGICQVVMDWEARSVFCGYPSNRDALFDLTPSVLARVGQLIYQDVISSLEHLLRESGNNASPDLHRVVVDGIGYWVLYGPHRQVIELIRRRLDSRGFKGLPFETPHRAPNSINLYIIGVERLPSHKGGRQ